MEIASKSQLRWAFVRGAAIIVPLSLLLVSLASQLSGEGLSSSWFLAGAQGTAVSGLAANAGLLWALGHVFAGIAAAIVWHARGNAMRNPGLGLFGAQLLTHLAWLILYFGQKMLGFGAGLILAHAALTALCAFLFWRVRLSAGILMALYLVWVGLNAYLVVKVGQGNVPAPAENSVEMQMPSAP
jgi:translocator protein